ncbi:3-carboxy-cis,cis-muconate cycloisomerase [Rhizobium oryzicola]|uniref:3-carboxy-cis,cis-muconate cycloisomerase n=1 Tax=Rhizobium oryzicola TaxID=1232668 RepID=A0ABT8SX16_9HYPH|nr:3-carboxy-cis,cis-muconate cycloisomerase [Rhizobium oryzicola]MDO1582970.1 3-carboxy-cis,cis-muconate cycloisomerase [Rhizobium oryzicola]
MSISAFEHPFLSGLVGDDETARFFTAEADVQAMLRFEIALARAEAGAGVIPQDAAARIVAVLQGFKPDMERLKRGTGRDGVVVAELVKQLRSAVGGDAAAHVHTGATSQDVIDTSLMLRLKDVLALFGERLEALISAFAALDDVHGRRNLMGHTRMQAALPITVADRLHAWGFPLARHRERLAALLGKGLPLQFGGAAGTLDKLGEKGIAIRAALASELGLADGPQWQSQRDILVEVADLLSLISGSLGKFGQDIALLAEMGGEIKLAGGGGSSAMAHKQNPVAAEVLVSLARFNAVQLSGMHHSLVHEQERSGAAWTLEWLILPLIVAATGASLRLAQELAGNIQSLGLDA